MIRLCFLVLVLILPVKGFAQTVVVRSGEHDGFTRLVFDLPRRSEYTLETKQQKTRLTFEATAFSFDTSSVFERITRERLASIQTSDQAGSIDIDLACDCKVEAFWHQQSMLVVDVQGHKALPPRPLARATEIKARPETALLSIMPAFPARNNMSGSQLIGGLADLTTLPHPKSGEVGEREMLTMPESDLDLQKSRDELIKQLGRAASQGLLTPTVALPQVDRSGAEAKSQPVTRETLPAPAPKETQKNLQLRAHSSNDQAFLDRLSEESSALSDATACLDPGETDVSTWATDAPFWQQISQQRSALTGELDRTNSDAVTALARIYVHFSFGLEAKQVLALDSRSSRSQKVIKSLAEIMDNGFAAPGSPLHNQFDCDAKIALWSVLAHQSITPDTRLSPDDIIQAFAGLPKHLRSHLGPVLSKRFSEAGRSQATQKVLRIINRIPDTVTPGSELALAELDRAAGENERAEQRLEEIVNSNAGVATQALVSMIDLRLAQKTDLSYEIAQLAGAYAYEHAGSAQGDELSRVHALALAASGAFDEAFAALAELDESLVEDVRPKLAEILTREAEDMDFLKYVLSGKIGPYSSLPTAAVLPAATRLVSAGFPDIATLLLDKSKEESASRAGRILKAEIALSRGLPRRAEVELLGLSGRDVNALRGRARSMVGEHAQARDLYLSAGLNDAAEREAWLAGSQDIPAPEAPEGDLADGILAQNRVLLDESDQTRKALQALLNEKPVPLIESN